MIDADRDVARSDDAGVSARVAGTWRREFGVWWGGLAESWGLLRVLAISGPRLCAFVQTIAGLGQNVQCQSAPFSVD